MSRAFWLKALLAIFLFTLAVIQFIPPAPSQQPAEPAGEPESPAAAQHKQVSFVTSDAGNSVLHRNLLTQSG
ncbi:MAG: hypothetical protein NWR12_03430 [Haliea sp.]|nr:hypothetical protein [Haliea sp.]